MNKIKESKKYSASFLKKIFAIFICAIMCASFSIAAPQNKQKAFATPSPEDAKAQMEALQPEFDEVSERVNSAEIELSEAKAKAYEAKNQIDECQTKIDETKPKVNSILKNQYMKGPFSDIEILLSSESLSEFIQNFDALNLLNRKHAQTIFESQCLKRELEESYVILEENLQAAKAKAEEAEEAKAEVQSKMNSLHDVIEASSHAEGGVNHPSTGGGGGGGHGPAPYLGDVVSTAYACIGCPYVPAAAGPSAFDCSGLVCWCYGCGGSHCWSTSTFMGQSSG